MSADWWLEGEVDGKTYKLDLDPERNAIGEAEAAVLGTHFFARMIYKRVVDALEKS